MHGLATILFMNQQIVSDDEHAVKMATLPREISVDRRRGGMFADDVSVYVKDLECEIDSNEDVTEPLIEKLDAFDNFCDTVFAPNLTTTHTKSSTPIVPTKPGVSVDDAKPKTKSLETLQMGAPAGVATADPVPTAGRGRAKAVKKQTSKPGVAKRGESSRGRGKNAADAAVKRADYQKSRGSEDPIVQQNTWEDDADNPLIISLLETDSLTDSIVNAKLHMANKSKSEPPASLQVQKTSLFAPESSPRKTSKLRFAPNEDEEAEDDNIVKGPRDSRTGMIKYPIIGLKSSISVPRNKSRRKTNFKPRNKLAAKTSSVRVFGGGAPPAVVRRKDLNTKSELLLYKMLRLSEISTVLKLEEERKKEIRCEWQQLAMLVDRLFLFLFIIGTISLWVIYFSSIPFYEKPILI